MKKLTELQIGFLAGALLLAGCTAKNDTSVSTPVPPADAAVSTSTAPQTKDWAAWLNKMPPGPTSLLVKGKVYVSNPGLEPRLSAAIPQGFNPKILMLELTLVQKPGLHAQVFVWADAKFEKSPPGVDYTQVDIRYQGELISTLPVKEVF